MPGGLTLLASLNVNIPTPAAGKVTIYFSTDLGTPAYKDDAGVVHTLVGTAGSPGPTGPALLAEDGIDGTDGFNIPVPGATGATGATGSAGPIGPAFLVQDGIDGEDGIPGTPGSSTPVATGPIFSASVTLTDAQIRSLNTVPVQMVAAPGAGISIIPIWWSCGTNITGVFNTTVNLNVRFVGGVASGVAAATMNMNALGKKLTNPGFAPLVNSRAATGIENTAVEVFGSGALTGGTTNGGTLFTVFYVLQTIP